MQDDIRMSIKVEIKWGQDQDGKYLTLSLVPGMVGRRLFDSNLPKILIVGESENFTFTTAFVVLRRSLKKVLTTTLEDLKPDWKKSRKTAISWVDENKMLGETPNDTTALTSPEVQARYDAVFGKDGTVGPKFFNKVDACNLHNCSKSIQNYCENVFFQCPYETVDSTGTLLRKFMKSAALVQKKGDTLYIGITTDGKYARAYQLKELIKHAPKYGYKFEGVDNTTIQKILAMGYKHCARKRGDELHATIFRTHATLIFTKIISKGLASVTVRTTSTTTVHELSQNHKEIATPSGPACATDSLTSTTLVDELSQLLESMTTASAPEFPD